MPTELQLDELFWKEISTSPTFQAWFLGRTKFADKPLKLTTDELWHQRWYKDPATGAESETDITLIFKNFELKELYSVHIENKPSHRTWEKDQAENYRKRAANRMIKWKHAGCQVALMAPREFIEKHPNEAHHFDFTISYEEVGVYVPEFREMCS